MSSYLLLAGRTSGISLCCSGAEKGLKLTSLFQHDAVRRLVSVVVCVQRSSFYNLFNLVLNHLCT